MIAERLLEKGWIPDSVVRGRIRSLLRQRLRQEEDSDQRAFGEGLRKQPIAVNTRAANEQHYEVPARFFELVLGKHLKYSCAWYDGGAHTLDQAEERMLELTAERAQLADGQRILELGCGWGSLSLWMAARYPRASILAVSNSHSQKAAIDAKAQERGLTNLEVVTADMNDFVPPGGFDRVVSVEMFEHMRNVPLLLKRVADALKPEGRLFVHIFTHRKFSYLFEDRDASDWMARHFFSGGMMPAVDLYDRFRDDLQTEQRWNVNGVNYAKTAEAWLNNLDRNVEEVRRLFEATYGLDQADRWIARWRTFFMSCAELWKFGAGEEWQVTHYRFRKTAEVQGV